MDAADAIGLIAEILSWIGLGIGLPPPAHRLPGESARWPLGAAGGLHPRGRRPRPCPLVHRRRLLGAPAPRRRIRPLAGTGRGRRVRQRAPPEPDAIRNPAALSSMPFRYSGSRSPASVLRRSCSRSSCCSWDESTAAGLTGTGIPRQDGGMPVPPLSSRPWLDSYAEGVPAEIDEPTQTLPEMLSASVKAFGRRRRWTSSARSPPTGSSGSRSSEPPKVSGGSGSARAIASPSCFPTARSMSVAFYATLRLGAIVVEHNPLLHAPRAATPVRRITAPASPSSGTRPADTWSPVFPQTSGFEHIVSVDIAAAMPLSKRVALRLPVAQGS